VFNVASGSVVTIRELASRFARALGKERIAPEITGKYRVGDIRHCFADISLAQSILGYRAQVSLQSGMEDLAEWLEGQIAFDRVGEMRAELSSRGLMV
jgi:dTDP-L-rhamnose 4-epimerase